jgi:putative PIN family toxin of toxin-antitoxin system
MLFFRAASRPERVRPIFDLVRNGSVTLCFSAEILAEIRDVLTRPKLTAKYPALTSEAVDAFLSEHLQIARWFDPVPEQFILTRDPKDSKYINLAIAAGGSYLVTTDLDMLDLITSQGEEARSFRQQYPSINILPPAAFEGAIAASEKS